MAMNKISPDAKGLFALPPPTYVLARVLGVATAESMTVPTGARYVLFSSSGDFHVSYTTTATVPADTTDGTACELNPELRDITGVTTISVISPAAQLVTAAFYV